MPVPLKSEYTLRKLLLNTYMHRKDRFDNMKRDVMKSITVKKVSVYDGKKPGEARTKFIIQSSSFPNYSPYFSARDSRGRSRTKQRTYRHEYDVTIQLDKLSIDVPVKLRTGSAVAWDFGPNGKSKKDARGRVIEGTNVKRQRNGDFFFRLEYLYAQAGCLFGRNFTNGPPSQTNPHGILFLDKHAISVVKTLMERGILTTGGDMPHENDSGAPNEAT